MTKPSRRQVLRTTAVAGGIALAGCSSGGSTATHTPTSGSDGSDGGSGAKWTETSTIEMTAGLKYVPKRAKVSKGTTVTWKNVGSIGHTVTAYEDKIPAGAAYFASGGYDSEKAARNAYSENNGGNIPEGETYQHTFETKGTYKYFCIPHELSGMVGFVKVV